MRSMSKERSILEKIDHLPLAAMSSSHSIRDFDSNCRRECYVGLGTLILAGGICLLVAGTIMLVSPNTYWADNLWIVFLLVGTVLTFLGISMTCYCSRKKTRYRTVNSDIINQTINQTILLHEGANRIQRSVQVRTTSSPRSSQAELLPRGSQGSASLHLVKKSPAFMNDPQYPVQFGVPWSNNFYDSTSQSSSGCSTQATSTTTTVQQPSTSSSSHGQSSSSSSSTTSVMLYSTSAPPKRLYKQSSC
ncbi:vitellogenin-1-like [Lineus longissimus]|uniref:vitellogenin-1-like n=1 Tax=Lineus longissimus TaxID=88925 RepID=UPI00315D11F6